MKRFLFAGLFLCLLTLLSCSRKKSQAQVSSDATQAPIETNDPLSQAEFAERISSQISELNKGRSILKEENAMHEEFKEYEVIIEDEDYDKNTDSIQESELSEEEQAYAAEEERLGTDVLNYLENESNFTSPITQTDVPVEDSVPDVETVEKRLVDAYSRLKVMEFESELFVPSAREDSSVLVHYSNKAAVRLFYDNLYRLTKKEYWKMDSVENAKITGTEQYSYKEESKKPYEKIITTEESIFVSKLNENGLVTRTEKYSVSKDNASVKKLVQTTTWTYDEKNRILSEAVKEGQNTKKQVFTYVKSDAAAKKSEEGDELPPDYEYYENGVLLTKTEYQKKGAYSTTIWFDKTTSVRTDYENYVKLREVYYINGVQGRVKNYE